MYDEVPPPGFSHTPNSLGAAIVGRAPITPIGLTRAKVVCAFLPVWWGRYLPLDQLAARRFKAFYPYLLRVPSGLQPLEVIAVSEWMAIELFNFLIFWRV